jgi:hypothetical protein
MCTHRPISAHLGRVVGCSQRAAFRSYQAGFRGVAQCDQPHLPRRPDARSEQNLLNGSCRNLSCSTKFGLNV